MKQYKELFVFGDSHAVPSIYVEPQKSFWGLLAKDIKAEVICNMAFTRNSFDAIVHLLTSNIDEFAGDDKLVIVGIPILERFSENHSSPKNRAIDNGQVFNKNLQLVGNRFFESLSGLRNIQLSESRSKSGIFNYDRYWYESQALCNIILLDNLFKLNEVNGIFVNLWHPFMMEVNPNTKALLSKVVQMKNQILFKDTLFSINEGVHKPVDYDKYNYHGHHGEDGNKNFYENSLLPQLKVAGLL